MKKNWLLEVATFLTVLLFFYAGLSKLVDHHEFVAHLKMSPWSLLVNTASLVSWLLPIGELVLSVILIIPATKRIGFVLSAVLLGIFIIYLGIIVSSGKKLPCSCGGAIKYLTWGQHIFFNIFFLLLSIIGYYKAKQPADHKLGRPHIKSAFNS